MDKRAPGDRSGVRNRNDAAAGRRRERAARARCYHANLDYNLDYKSTVKS
jgi:hypothetical protein